MLVWCWSGFGLVLFQSWSGKSLKSLYKVRLGFKSNHKVPVQVQVKPTLFFWSWSGESFKSLAQVLAEIFLQRGGVGGEGGVGHVKSSGLFNVEVKDKVQIECYAGRTVFIGSKGKLVCIDLKSVWIGLQNNT